MAYTIGIDLGGTNIVAGVVDAQGTLLGIASQKTNLPASAPQIADRMAVTAQAVAERTGVNWAEVTRIGAGIPGSVDSGVGMVEYANNLDFYHVPMRELLESRLKRPVVIANDANAAAYGEYSAGRGKNAKSFIALTLGTGVGSGVILNGQLLEGCNASAGELGHLPIRWDGVPCTCGLQGCFEAYASATALIEQTKAAMQDCPTSYLWQLCHGDLAAVDGKTAFDGKRAGDATAAGVVDQYLTYLGVGITGIINIFQPEVLCIGGGLSREGDTLLEPVRRFVAEHGYSRFSKPQTRIEAALLGNDAGVIGAALLASSFSAGATRLQS